MRLYRNLGIVIVAGGLSITNALVAASNSDVVRDQQMLKDFGIGSSDQALLEFFRNRTLNVDPGQVQRYIGQLGDESYDTRERASARLVALGQAAEPFLTKAIEAFKSSRTPDMEALRRAEDCLGRVKQGVSAALPAAAARLLARQKPGGAVEVLLGYLPFAPTAAVVDDIDDALAALAVRDGKIDPVLTAAISDSKPIRRAAAGQALARTKLSEGRTAAKKLLYDPDFEVRLPVAMAFVSVAHDREAVPELIDLLGEVPRDRVWKAEELLLRLAGDNAPTVTLGETQASRENYRQAWKTWWKEKASSVDLARLGQPPPVFGYTAVVFLDAGRVLELDRDKKARWQIDGLQFPLDFQYLPGQRVLVAENHGNRVTERDLTGRILWEKAVDAPLMAQRLPNGNTFIGTTSQLIEVNPAGKEVFTYTPHNGDYIMKAEKLSNGEIACVLSGGPRFVRLDKTGKELKSFAVNLRTSGGRIDVLPNGHVLVPENGKDRVVEHDETGQQVWEARVSQPISAVRLANGNTLVTSMNQLRAIEFDPKGKEVWQYRGDTRINRAYRR